MNVTTLEMPRRESVAGAIARNSAGYSIAPVAMMAPWPGIRRGTRPWCRGCPGFVREIVVPSKSDSFSFPARARATTSSAAREKLAKRIFSAPLTFGTRSVREPSDFSTSTAMPKWTSSRRIRAGSPLDAS